MRSTANPANARGQFRIVTPCYERAWAAVKDDVASPAVRELQLRRVSPMMRNEERGTRLELERSCDKCSDSRDFALVASRDVCLSASHLRSTNSSFCTLLESVAVQAGILPQRSSGLGSCDAPLYSGVRD